MGRLGSFPDGIALLTAADYFTLSSRAQVHKFELSFSVFHGLRLLLLASFVLPSAFAHLQMHA